MKKQTNQSKKTLAQWLSYIEAQHPDAIAMGLDRVSKVADKLKLNPSFPIVTVAGTNGKGSTCAFLEHIYHQAGYRVGAYTSPHFIRYNERVRVDKQTVADAELCEAFEAVEKARGRIKLTYFEMGTLAAVWIFMQLDLDVAILEVGMGGRLDAVNVFTPACTIITSIGLDHTAYLGETREEIGLEKAGVFRSKTLAVCGELEPPKSLLHHAKEVGAELRLINRDFSAHKTLDGWEFEAEGVKLALSPLVLLGDFQLNNAACAVVAVLGLAERLPVPVPMMRTALSQVTLMGRYFQASDSPLVIVDVAHNVQAAKSLADNLAEHACKGRTLAVFSMLADKDIKGVAQQLAPHVDRWCLAKVSSRRGAATKTLQTKLLALDNDIETSSHKNIAEALNVACMEVDINDRIIVFGSFYTVADALKALNFSRLPNA